MNPSVTLVPSAPLISAQHLSVLRSTDSLLHLLHHRNHNQHRAQKWYPHFSTLRRQLRKLLSEYEDYEAASPAGGLAVLKSKARRVEARVEFVREKVLRGCWR